jgi:hypothetical protein
MDFTSRLAICKQPVTLSDHIRSSLCPNLQRFCMDTLHFTPLVQKEPDIPNFLSFVVNFYSLLCVRRSEDCVIRKIEIVYIHCL